MTKSQIEKAARREMVKFELAGKIRELLDAARKEYGAEDWQNDDVESHVQDLVFGE